MLVKIFSHLKIYLGWSVNRLMHMYWPTDYHSSSDSQSGSVYNLPYHIAHDMCAVHACYAYACTYVHCISSSYYSSLLWEGQIGRSPPTPTCTWIITCIEQHSAHKKELEKDIHKHTSTTIPFPPHTYMYVYQQPQWLRKFLKIVINSLNGLRLRKNF